MIQTDELLQAVHLDLLLLDSSQFSDEDCRRLSADVWRIPIASGR